MFGLGQRLAAVLLGVTQTYVIEGILRKPRSTLRSREVKLARRSALSRLTGNGPAQPYSEAARAIINPHLRIRVAG